MVIDQLTETERGQIDAVVRLVRDVLGDDAIGAYMFGSSVTTGLRADSDLDILLVSSRRTSESERRSLGVGDYPMRAGVR